MITCSVCLTENDKYETICRKCGGFLQNRVPNLDLFSMIWKTIENPREAFRLIMMAEHKNYALLLYTLCGISASFAGFWNFKLGNRFENLLFLIFWGLLIGTLIGVLMYPIFSAFHWMLSKTFGGKGSFRTSMGLTSYALIPIVLALIFVAPVEFMTFGMYLFTSNPNPMAIKPALYIILNGFNIAAILWTSILLIIGTIVGNQISLRKSVLIVAILCALALIGFYYGGEYVVRFL
jgi:hypothetical protein